jgi:squalene-hopene/tetraprenyl-beta-curcumene cyclase
VPEPRPEDVQRTIDQGLAWLVSLQKPDGSIHDGKLANYVTSAAVLALARSQDPTHAQVVARARDFLVALQADEGEHYSPDDPYYGGIGYGNDERPDLSNLQMSLEALAAAGLEAGDPAFQRALTFLQRCQNRSESNDVRIVEGRATIASGDDGGGVYAPGGSEAGFVELDDGTRVPRSYGSMTYALLKSYVLAGVPKEDPRMKAVWGWLREHWTLDVNPGMEVSGNPTSAYDGLFYYFATMAKALDLYGAEVVLDQAGRENRWRSQLAGRLVAMQRRTDGSWVNQNSSRWWESNPILATAYAMIALGVTRG